MCEPYVRFTHPPSVGRDADADDNHVCVCFADDVNGSARCRASLTLLMKPSVLNKINADIRPSDSDREFVAYITHTNTAHLI